MGIETPSQRLAEVSKEHSENIKRYNSPLAQVQRRAMTPDNAQWEKDSVDRSKARVVQVVGENKAMGRMNDISKSKSPLATTMTKGNK
jgi:hypothetical protein